ncbi:uncharacterized protein BCR38DRAFT_432048 [Pseudomassariella vexata]|uniref:Uncharacterized protein n=1 Tax=Pseudomassariella vexata TaxID=1141098 RepID=A0A1Y2E0V1_9PEZI|nr:uncharacterized protein BCR38DRAFT_432048 [Pseudomassariella vexata]ORY65168.1 hypothetical protein BCR38DRAFT_432048 [Pseudomassariella vexata]
MLCRQCPRCSTDRVDASRRMPDRYLHCDVNREQGRLLHMRRTVHSTSRPALNVVLQCRVVARRTSSSLCAKIPKYFADPIARISIECDPGRAFIETARSSIVLEASKSRFSRKPSCKSSLLLLGHLRTAFHKLISDVESFEVVDSALEVAR